LLKQIDACLAEVEREWKLYDKYNTIDPSRADYSVKARQIQGRVILRSLQTLLLATRQLRAEVNLVRYGTSDGPVQTAVFPPDVGAGAEGNAAVRDNEGRTTTGGTGSTNS